MVEWCRGIYHETMLGITVQFSPCMRLFCMLLFVYSAAFAAEWNATLPANEEEPTDQSDRSDGSTVGREE